MLREVFSAIVKPHVGAKLFSKKLFVWLYTTNDIQKIIAIMGVTPVYDGKLHIKTTKMNEVSISCNGCYLYGQARNGAFHILNMNSMGSSIATARGAMLIIKHLVSSYSKVDPGSMSKFSSRLYWSCIRRMK